MRAAQGSPVPHAGGGSRLAGGAPAGTDFRTDPLGTEIKAPHLAQASARNEVLKHRPLRPAPRGPAEAILWSEGTSAPCPASA